MKIPAEQIVSSPSDTAPDAAARLPKLPTSKECLAASQADPHAGKLVSVVIPCYDGARFLPAAIESCLRQTYRNLEIIVVDDASPDDSAVIAERYARLDSRVRVIRRPQNGGVSRAFNSGFEAARGEYFTRLAQDDFFRDDAVEAMVRRLDEAPGAGLTYGACQGFAGAAIPVGECGKLPDPSQALNWRNGIGICALWRRAVWEAVGGFDPEFDTAEDFEYWLRISRSFSLTPCPGGPFLWVRLHDNQGTIRFADKQEQASERIIRKYFRADSLGNFMLRCRSYSYFAYSAATDYSYSGMHVRALNRIVRSMLLWPLPFPSETSDSTEPPRRIKTLIVIVMRILKLRPGERLAGSKPQPAWVNPGKRSTAAGQSI